MSPTSIGPWGPNTVPVLSFVLVLNSILWASALAENSKFYHMQSLCKNHFLQQLYRKIDGAVLLSQNERNLDCVITFQTHSVLQRFMLRFDILQLDCNDHLYIYDGAHAGGLHKADITCRNTKESVGIIFPRSNLVTLKYVTDGWGTDSNGFKLVITALKEPKHACKDFRCNTREFCIHKDLVCDGVDHCGDGSDEASNTICQNDTKSQIFGMDMTWFTVTLLSLLLVLSACAVSIIICYCRKKHRKLHHSINNQIQLQQVYDLNGEMKPSMPHGTTLLHQIEKRHCTVDHVNATDSENWTRPATKGYCTPSTTTTKGCHASARMAQRQTLACCRAL
ncbi:uncharacterized protein LOC113385117 [Ctenocephalides felis]|uniref:uncharacterized protein LOC113385117 n=1 Tax=Ctenocephalides felis TaxID=7515 RepID=UPI000E6E43B7|nr:uncharacterized protein LOC113385117 [Ctenocephalides felis]